MTYVNCFVPLQDDAVMLELGTTIRGLDSQSWAKQAHAWLFEKDVFEGLGVNEVVMRIHATAEEFDPTAEKLFIPSQACKRQEVLLGFVPFCHHDFTMFLP